MKKKTGIHILIMFCICFSALVISTGCGGCNSCGYACGKSCSLGGCVCNGCLNCIGASGCIGCIYGCLGYDME